MILPFVQQEIFLFQSILSRSKKSNIYSGVSGAEANIMLHSNIDEQEKRIQALATLQRIADTKEDILEVETILQLLVRCVTIVEPGKTGEGRGARNKYSTI